MNPQVSSTDISKQYNSLTMLKLLIACAVVLVVVQGQPWGPEEYGNEGVGRPYGFPYVAPYVQAPYPGYVPGYYGYGFPYHHNYFPHAPRVPHGAYVYIGHFKGKCRLLLITLVRDSPIHNNEITKSKTKWIRIMIISGLYIIP